MKINIFLLIICLVLVNPCFSQISTMEEESLAHLNQQLRKIEEDTYNEIIDLYTEVSGILPMTNGGLGVALEDPDADRIVFWDDSETQIDWLVANDGLEIVDKNLNNTESGLGTGTVLYQWWGDESCDLSHGGGFPTVANFDDSNCLYFTTNNDSVIFRSKFQKTAHVSTVTVYARQWHHSASSEELKSVVIFNIGGETASVYNLGGTPAWTTSGEIDVSGLTNGTVYDVLITLDVGFYATYCSGWVMLVKD